MNALRATLAILACICVGCVQQDHADSWPIEEAVGISSAADEDR